MSEPMSSVEIEDVLSSIRRLVSEDLRPGHRTVPDPRNLQSASQDKLILTPAFRVAVPSLPAAELMPEPRNGPLPRLHLGGEPVARLAASTLERAVEAQANDWESEVGDPPPMMAQIDWSSKSRVAPTAEVVRFVPAAPMPTAPIPAAPTQTLPIAASGSPDHSASWAQIDPGTADFGLSESEATLPPPITEPDPLWADQAEAEAGAALEAEVGAVGTTAEPAEMRLDEQVLRELVRELILGELQGTLGERMTRNVRKLVRAEIARALALREAE